MTCRPWQARRRRRRTPSAPGASLRDRRVGLDLEALQAEQVVAVGRTPVFRVQAPAGEGAALRDDHALGARLGHHDLRRDRVGLVLDVQEAVLAEAAHAAEEQLRVSLHELRPADELRRRSARCGGRRAGARCTCVASSRQSCCSSASFSGIAAGLVVGLTPVARFVELPDVVLERRQRLPHQPRDRVAGDRSPALVVDAAVAEHLEVLRLVAIGLRRTVEGIAHARAFDRALIDAVTVVGCGSPAASSTVGATSITWWNCERISPRAVNPLGQCTIVPLRVPPQCEATCFVHW